MPCAGASGGAVCGRVGRLDPSRSPAAAAAATSCGLGLAGTRVLPLGLAGARALCGRGARALQGRQRCAAALLSVIPRLPTISTCARALGRPCLAVAWRAVWGLCAAEDGGTPRGYTLRTSSHVKPGSSSGPAGQRVLERGGIAGGSAPPRWGPSGGRQVPAASSRHHRCGLLYTVRIVSLCEVAPRESAGALLGTLLGGASQFGSRAICTVIDRFPVNDGPCLPSGAAKPCMVQTTPADSPRREVDRGTDAIFTFDERYNIDHIVPLHGHFCPIIGIQATHPRNAPR